MTNNLINENLDLRIRRTHKLLFDSLTSLLTEKSFDNIRISDICDKAMVHRTTFYKHFEEKSLQYTPIDNTKQYYTNLFRLLLEHMCENRKMYTIGLLNNGSAMKLLQKIVLQCIKSKLENDEKNGIKFIVPTDVIAEFYSPALVYSAGEWLEEGMPISIDQMVQYCDIIADTLRKTHKNQYKI